LGWYRHFISWVIGGAILAAIILFINNPSQTKALQHTLGVWSLILVWNGFGHLYSSISWGEAFFCG
jgi:hypothetical protein